MKRLFFLTCSLGLICLWVMQMAKKGTNNTESFILKQEFKLHNAYPEMNIVRSENIITMQVNENSIYFDLDSYILTEAAKEKLLPLIDILDKRNTITISGHTCDLGDDGYNLLLSEKRAQQVKDFIQYKKPSITSTYAYGYGEKFPVTNNSEEGRRLNRRVEIKIEVADEVKEKPTSGIPGENLTRHPTPENGGNDDKPTGNRLEVIGAESTDWNAFFEKYNWAILTIGLIGTLFSTVDIIRKWNS